MHNEYETQRAMRRLWNRDAQAIALWVAYATAMLAIYTALAM